MINDNLRTFFYDQHPSSAQFFSSAVFKNDPEYAGWVWALVDVDPALIDDKAERVNITVPRRILSRIDRYASSHGETRSGLLVRAALERIVAHP